MAALEFSSTPLFGQEAHYWKLEDVNATTGGVNLTNNNTVAFNAAKFNNGADTGAANANKSLTAASDLGIAGGAVSISLWVNITSAPSNSQQDLFSQTDAGTNTRYTIRYSDTAGTKTIHFLRTKVGVGDEEETVAQDLGTGTFHHLVLTYNTTVIEGYYDGASTGTTTASGDGSAGGVDGVTIGTAAGAGGSFFSGLIDDVVLFTRALTDDEVASLFSGDFPVVANPNPNYSFFM